MTISVADKTPIPEKVWRRHTDPPGLWIAVGISSVALHLLVFWLMRSYAFNLLFPQQSQVVVPIELIEISPKVRSQSKPVAKPVAPNPPPKTQNSQATKLPQQVAPIDRSTLKSSVPNIPDETTIASASQKRAIAQQRQQKLNEQLRQQQLAEKPRQQQLNEQLRQQQLAEKQRQQQLAEQYQQQLAEKQRQQQLNEQYQQRPGGEQLTPPQTQSNKGLFALWVPVSEEEQRALMREPLPQELKLAEHIGRNEKEVASIYINSNLELPAVEFLVSLIVDRTGKFIEAKVIDPAIPAAQRSKYEQFANDVFRGEKFHPARYTDDTTPPELSNRFVRLKIERR